jgi:deferrochelatase/peroxidase EfeB
MSNSPFLPSRRTLLTGLSAAALSTPALATEPPVDPTLVEHPFFGVHQAGVITPQPAAALVVSFDTLAGSRQDLETVLRGLTDRIAFLMAGGDVPAINPLMPPPDSGLLGPRVTPNNLTMTLAVGASLFDGRYGLADRRPKALVTMTQFPNDALDSGQCHGDLLLQICSASNETNIHALRDIIKHFPGQLIMRWKIDGFLPPRTLRHLGRDTVRNLLGFKDGTANLDASDAQLMDRLVWVQPGDDEPAWTVGGSYQVVRVIQTLVERWDRTSLHEQQTIIGRDKATGAPLGMSAEHDTPDFTGDPAKQPIPKDAHIRLANPRTADTQQSLILRRPYNFSRDMTPAGQLDMGLLFICFQANLKAGFLTVQARLNGEPLEEYIKPVGGGYFFVLPGVRDKSAFLGEALLA